MGGISLTKSQNVSNIINDTVNNITNDATKSCVADTTNNQNIKVTVKNVSGCSMEYGSSSQTINASTNSVCTQVDVSEVSLLNKMKNAVDQLAETKKTAATLGLFDMTESSNFQNTLNKVTNSTTIKNLSQAMTRHTNFQNNELVIDGFTCFPRVIKDANGNETVVGDKIEIKDVNQAAVSAIVASVLQQSTAVTTVVNDIDNKLSQTAKAANLGLFDGLAQAWYVILLILLLPLLMGGVSSMTRSSQGSAGSYDDGQVVKRPWQLFYSPRTTDPDKQYMSQTWWMIVGLVFLVAVGMGAWAAVIMTTVTTKAGEMAADQAGTATATSSAPTATVTQEKAANSVTVASKNLVAIQILAGLALALVALSGFAYMFLYAVNDRTVAKGATFQLLLVFLVALALSALSIGCSVGVVVIRSGELAEAKKFVDSIKTPGA